MSDFDPTQYSDALVGILNPESIMTWALLIIGLLAPVFVIQFGFGLGGAILNKIGQAIRNIR